MPKMKTHSGAKKRFSLTGSGKVAYQKSGRRHILVNKSERRMRKLRSKGIVSPQFEGRLKKLLPYA
ncbi:MAG: 50S ribosomal protein L35 [Synergistaceae bacterium]|jgi:large subunit ribosomal protein L35|nr:50S ribosomal protein L35 [Synergistaceae bacterium]